MVFKDISFSSPLENILFDDVLLRLAEQGEGEETLRLWESPSVFIVLGRIGKAEEDILVKQANSDGTPILRRSSGGGTVLQGPGCLNFSFILSKEKNPKLNDLRHSYQIILQKVIDVFTALGLITEFRPISDLAVVEGNKKFSGNAQKRGKRFILHHGTILYNFDLNLITRYLQMPKDIPAYRQNRRHAEFVTNVPYSANQIRAAFKKVLGLPELVAQITLKEQQLLSEFIQKQNAVIF